MDFLRAILDMPDDGGDDDEWHADNPTDNVEFLKWMAKVVREIRLTGKYEMDDIEKAELLAIAGSFRSSVDTDDAAEVRNSTQNHND